eukprot:2203604-Prymnesium_polylepis.1
MEPQFLLHVALLQETGARKKCRRLILVFCARFGMCRRLIFAPATFRRLRNLRPQRHRRLHALAHPARGKARCPIGTSRRVSPGRC